jgi:hypothetical protein
MKFAFFFENHFLLQYAALFFFVENERIIVCCKRLSGFVFRKWNLVLLCIFAKINKCLEFLTGLRTNALELVVTDEMQIIALDNIQVQLPSLFERFCQRKGRSSAY